MISENLAKILLALSIISNLTAYVIYIRLMVTERIKPHSITFLVWAIILGINFLVQVFSGVGLGSILIATNLLGCLIVFGFSYKKFGLAYDKLDWACFILALVAIGLWVVSKTPLYSVILSCVIDFLALLPSFRKSFHKPNEDSSLTFFISGLEYLFSLPSYLVFSFLVLAYPICVLTLDFSYAAFITIRRFQIKKLTITS
ncbi:MAG: hypothetical protein WC794_04075 [Candidatus Doudnabacteria bacterium]